MDHLTNSSIYIHNAIPIWHLLFVNFGIEIIIGENALNINDTGIRHLISCCYSVSGACRLPRARIDFDKATEWVLRYIDKDFFTMLTLDGGKEIFWKHFDFE